VIWGVSVTEEPVGLHIQGTYAGPRILALLSRWRYEKSVQDVCIVHYTAVQEFIPENRYPSSQNDPQ
jgi:hypothetical protein